MLVETELIPPLPDSPQLTCLLIVTPWDHRRRVRTGRKREALGFLRVTCGASYLEMMCSQFVPDMKSHAYYGSWERASGIGTVNVPLYPHQRPQDEGLYSIY